MTQITRIITGQRWVYQSIDLWLSADGNYCVRRSPSGWSLEFLDADSGGNWLSRIAKDFLQFGESMQEMAQQISEAKKARLRRFHDKASELLKAIADPKKRSLQDRGALQMRLDALTKALGDEFGQQALSRLGSMPSARRVAA